MKILFEQYPYSASHVNRILDADLYTECANGTIVIPYVGYFYSPEVEGGGDSIFILPKVFLSQIKEKEGNKEKFVYKAFGRYLPEDIIDLEGTILTEHNDNEIIFGLSTWLYRAIAHYVERNNTSTITTDAFIQNVVSVKGNDFETFLDVVLSLLRFQKEHKNLLTYIMILNNSGKSTINWGKTIDKTSAILKDGKPFYPDMIAKDKAINLDEDLIVLYYSVLNYLKSKYNYKLDKRVGYNIIKPSKIQQYIDSGKGVRLLKNLRKKYFTDELVALWRLLMVFFEKSHRVATKKYSKEKLLVRNFNIVFEDMIDQLIGDSKINIIDPSLKDQEDGKRVDHIYKDASLFPDSDIYFIGDSKYYKDGNDVDGSSFYKQYTYAKNVIQVCMNIFNNKDGKDKLGTLRYVDEKTEGYNITPNFFIRGSITDFENINYSEVGLINETPENISAYRSTHWKNRLFDRDTLILQSYTINFLYVLTSYVANSDEKAIKAFIHKKFRSDIINTLNRNYTFYKITPLELDTFIEKHFRLLNGKMFRGSDDDKFIWLAFENHSTLSKIVESKIRPDIIEDLLEPQPLA